jgi:hypothetical protein
VDLFGTSISLHPQRNTRPSCQPEQPVSPTPSDPCFAVPAQAAAFTYTSQYSLVFGGHTVATGEEDESLILPHHSQDLAASDCAFEFADYANFPLPDFGHLTMPLLVPQQLETNLWAPFYMDSTLPVPSLTDSDYSLPSPASSGSTTDSSSLIRSDASSPWELNIAWDPSLYVQCLCEKRPSS